MVVRLSGDFQPELTVVIANEDGETEPAIVEMAYEEVVVEETDEADAEELEEETDEADE